MTLHQRAKLIVYTLLPTGLSAREFEHAVMRQGKYATEVAGVYSELCRVKEEAGAQVKAEIAALTERLETATLALADRDRAYDALLERVEKKG